ncbi:crotonobetainyl-CoA:carnitine CoA-transferase CaiB-like acyl-CoA transferase [Litorivivens lipolytica]|uniref:Crotonobetainyl-CoA:carnitine CoA-transferase CaiB-like acyl-CoA transferase n=1 Tax=Litorivivens lipolytica TaxID=1524264 RepID=A0A7W4W745_9GAMM|nr:CaiB/BaiF CoA-transferase family protein [Litorivivens lipolytica]MBB3048731.1 crotonobetainyl-CoA:carnitine CoA-transferase CaiB-like acyl-CoA transferase [Litorivivens lipolytica]
MTEQSNQGPLAGIRVLELGQLLAGPFTGSILGYFGAEVIKVEPPEGDQIRRWRIVKDDTALWWYSLGRNKQSIVIDLKSEEGREIVRELANECDVLIENFRPGVMEKWGLGPEDLKATNPDLIYTRISGYGQTGPYSTKPGFASVCEGISGFRFLNGFPDEAPVRPNLSIGDSIASLHAVIGILMSLTAKLRNRASGQVVDVALYESMFNLLEGVVPEYSGAGVIRQPSGTTVTGIVPTNTYRCEDGKFVVIGGNGDSIFKRLMIAIGREDMANDPELADNAGRVTHERAIDKVLASWCSSLDSKQVIAALEEARVPVGPIYNVEDMFNDPHFQARGLFEEVPVGNDTVYIPAITPKLSDTPGATRWPGPKLGEHSESVLKKVLGKDDAAIAQLRQNGAIG